MNEVLIFLLGALIGDLVPNPFDAVHFYLQNYLYRHKLKRWVFELLQIFDWYVLDGFWWILVIGLYFAFGWSNLSEIQSIYRIATVIGIGATIGIIWRFLRQHK